MEGHHDAVHKLTLARLNMEDAAFVVKSKHRRRSMANDTYQIEGRIKKVNFGFHIHYRYKVWQKKLLCLSFLQLIYM